MDAKTLESLFMILDDACESGKLTEQELTDAMVLLAVDLSIIEHEPRDHVVLFDVLGEMTNIYGPLTNQDASHFIQHAMTNWASDLDSVQMTKIRLTSPALGNAPSVSPSTPLDSDIITAMGIDNE